MTAATQSPNLVSMAHSYNIDTGAWIQDSHEGWVSSRVVAKTVTGKKVQLVFELTGGARSGEVGLLPLKDGADFCYWLTLLSLNRKYKRRPP